MQGYAITGPWLKSGCQLNKIRLHNTTLMLKCSMSKYILLLIIPLISATAQDTAQVDEWLPGEIKVVEVSEAKVDDKIISRGQKLTVPVQIASGKGCTLLFSNGTVLVIDKNTKLGITQFDQLGRFEIGNITAEDNLTKGTHRPLSGINKEPSISKTAITLFTGAYYGQTKILHKDSTFTTNNLLGTASIVNPDQKNSFRSGTKWRQSNIWNESKLTLETRTDVAKGYLNYEPIKGQASEMPKIVNLTDYKSLLVTGEFTSNADFQLLTVSAINVTLKINLEQEIWRQGTITFPNAPEGARIGLLGNPMPVMTTDFGGDQGALNVGTLPLPTQRASGSQGGGSQGGQLPTPPAPAS